MSIQSDAQDAFDQIARNIRDRRESERLAALRLEARKANAADTFATWANDNFFGPDTDDTDTEGQNA